MWSARALLAVMACAPAPGAVKTIEIAATGNSAATVLLLNAGPDCRQPRAVRATARGAVQVTNQLGRQCWQCGATDARLRPRVAVFSPGHAVTYLEGEQLCSRVSGTRLVIRLEPRKRLPVDVWLEKEEQKDWALDEFANADWILDRNGAGVTLEPNFRKLEPHHQMPPDCEALFERFQEGRRSLPHNPDRLNVYFTGPANQNCEFSKALFVQSRPALGDLAHEMSHRLGLQHGDNERDYPGGHTTNQPGFDCSNTMWQHSGIPDANLTLGQVFWMGVSCNSAAATPGSCVPCDPKAGADFRCVPFRLGMAQARDGCKPCTAEDARRIRAAFPAALKVPENLAAGASQMCTLGELRGALSRRFRALAEHTRNTPELMAKPKNHEAFIERWALPGAVVLAVDLAAQATGQARGTWIRYFENQLKTDGPYNNDAYLKWAVQLLRQGKRAPRCIDGPDGSIYR